MAGLSTTCGPMYPAPAETHMSVGGRGVWLPFSSCPSLPRRGGEPPVNITSLAPKNAVVPKAPNKVVLLVLFALKELMSCQLMSLCALCNCYGNWAGGEPKADVIAE